MQIERDPYTFGMDILNTLALLIVALTGVYFIALSVLSFAAPARASVFLMGFASSAATHYAELLVRMMVGSAFIAASPVVPFQAAFAVFGWVLVGTTAVLFLVPWQLHRKFAERAVPRALRHLRLIAVASLFLGAFVLWSVARSAT